MSRVGKNPIKINDKIKVTANGQAVTVEGPKGKLNYILPQGILLANEDNQISIMAESDDYSLRKFHGLARAMINNMVIGVTEGFIKELELVGVGYKAQMKGRDLTMALGFSHPVDIKVWEGLNVSCPSATSIKIEGIDKQRVGEFAAQIRRIRKPEPYKGKGIRYAGEQVRRKAGKSMSK